MYKKISKLIFLFMLLVFIALVLFLKPSFPRSFHHFYTPNTNLKNENINGFYLDDNINEDHFLTRYGKQTHMSQDNIFYHYYEIQDGMEIATNNKGEIVRFGISEKGIHTSKGIEVGNEIKKAKDLYGKKYYKRVELGLDIIGYVDKEQHQSIEFWYDPNNQIIMYRLDDSAMD